MNRDSLRREEEAMKRHSFPGRDASMAARSAMINHQNNLGGSNVPTHLSRGSWRTIHAVNASTDPNPQEGDSSKGSSVETEDSMGDLCVQEEGSFGAEAQLIKEAAAKLTITHEDVVIAVMGMTGTGKSTFIKHLTKDGVKIGHTLQSCTAQVGIHPFTRKDGRTIYLIDTPGFDDTKRSDTQILNDVAYFLGAMYSRDIKLAGIIYLHRIIDPRMTGSAFRNLSLFQKLCGTTSLSNVVLATTMWDKLKDLAALEQACSHETELVKTPEFWGDMLEEGSKVFRQDRGISSALDIVNYIMNLKLKDVVLDIQREMIDDHQSLNKTTAGKEVQRDLLEAQTRHAEELANLEDSLQAAIDSNNQKATEKFLEMQEKLKAESKQLEIDMEQMKQDFTTVQEEKDAENKKMIQALRSEAEAFANEANASKEAFAKMKDKQEKDKQDFELFRIQTMKSEASRQKEMNEKEAEWDRKQKQWQKDMETKNEELMKQQESRKGVIGMLSALVGVAVIGAGLMTMNPVIMGMAGSLAGGGGGGS